jgi:hypothetical protein
MITACVSESEFKKFNRSDASVTVVDRLDQYDREYNASGHPKVGPYKLLVGLGRQPYDVIISRINSSEDYDRYSAVIYEMDRNGDIDICESNNMKSLVDRLKKVGGLRRTPYPVEFLKCYLPENAYTPT